MKNMKLDPLLYLAQRNVPLELESELLSTSRSFILGTNEHVIE